MNAISVTTMMLPSRRVRNRCARLRAPPRWAQPLAGPVGSALAGGVPSDATAIVTPPLGLLAHPSRRAGAFVPALGGDVGLDRCLVEELDAGVHVGDAGQALRRLVHVELEDRQEPLQVGLLV